MRVKHYMMSGVLSSDVVAETHVEITPRWRESHPLIQTIRPFIS